MSVKEAVKSLGKKYSPEAIEQITKDIESKVQARKLTIAEREIYGGAVITASSMMPAFRDAIKILNPYIDTTAPTAYVDPHARMGLSYWFLYEITSVERASVILHECLHVLNNHFSRADVEGIEPKYRNIAGDLEINSILSRARSVALPEGCLYPDRDPYNFPRGQSMETYAHLLKEDGHEPPEFNDSGMPNDGSGDGSEDNDSQGSGDSDQSDQSSSSSASCQGKETGPEGKDGKPGWGCSDSSEEREKMADEAGVEKSSSAEQTTVIRNTIARVREEAEKSLAAGNSHANELYNLILERIYQPKVNWRNIFRREVGKANSDVARGRASYSYRRVNRRLTGGKYIFPGMVKYTPTMMLGLDISGSMSKQDYQLFMTELEGIMKSCSKSKNALSIFPVDTQVGDIKPVRSVKEVNLYGGGGTRMEVALEYVKTIPKKTSPDIFVLATDGGTNWHAFEREALDLVKYCRVIVLVTNEMGWNSVTDSLKNLVTMIDVSEK